MDNFFPEVSALAAPRGLPSCPDLASVPRRRGLPTAPGARPVPFPKPWRAKLPVSRLKSPPHPRGSLGMSKPGRFCLVPRFPFAPGVGKVSFLLRG